MSETAVAAREARPKFRKDYRQPDYWIDRVDLVFELGEDETLVRAKLSLRRNEEVNPGGAPLVLHGEELQLRSIAVDGRALDASEYTDAPDEETLTLHAPPDAFELSTEVAIHPERNSKLSGLYKSSGNFCTQCEAEGFRRITYFLDRPDVMARYVTKVIAERERYPVLLSNGNRIQEGALEDGRHWAVYEDPFPKPSYLFALVAGNLRCHEGSFTTASGRDVRLEIWVEPQNIEKCEHALRSLQRSMKWDEERFGLEYDLDVYMIVAVNDFNMGAMENKGLNVFNSKFVLASPDSATDVDYEGIEGVIAHEYFHNWTGNRVTCRDWFQLTLKEGLTVFRDQEFSADCTSAAVKRIDEVCSLRSRQFAEDGGPMAHPVRPESYVEMNNFYTATVYEKGAEVVRMYQTLLGREGFRRGMDLYFERHDGGAVTCDDFRAAMADANGVDLTQFERWYLQAGTPTLEAEGSWDAADGRFSLTLRQSREAIDGHADYEPTHMPVAIGLLGAGGGELPLHLVGEDAATTGTRVLELRESERTFVFQGLSERPVPSILRGFSAPVRLRTNRTPEDLAFLMAHDTDAFQRWEAGQELARAMLLELAATQQRGDALALDPLYSKAFGALLADERADGSLCALAMRLPGEAELAQEMDPVDPAALFAARSFAMRALAAEHREALEATYRRNRVSGPYRYAQDDVARRRLANAALVYLACLETPETTALAWEQFDGADNMTDAEAALCQLVELDAPERERALAAFHETWRGDPLVLDKWFRIQALSGRPDTLARVRELSLHADFTLDNPNRARSLVGAFAMLNHARFHDPSGDGYEFLAENVLALDKRNPQVAARLVGAFNPWRRYVEPLRSAMKARLERIAASEELSKDVGEIVGRALGRIRG